MNIATQLNILMDEHVGLYYTKRNGKENPHLELCNHLLAQQASFWLPFDRPTTNIAHRLLTFWSGHAAESELARMLYINQEHLWKINWEVILSSVKKNQSNKKQWYKSCICPVVHNENIKSISNLQIGYLPIMPFRDWIVAPHPLMPQK